MDHTLPKLGVTIGDINGIGIELIMKIFSKETIFNLCTPIIYGSSKALSYHKNVLSFTDFQYHNITKVDRAKEGVCNILNCWQDELPITIGRPNKKLGPFELKSLQICTDDLISGELDAMITAPINKNNVHSPENAFAGQTEFLTNKFDDLTSLMILANEQSKLRVGLVTNHLAVADISKNITMERILKKARVMNLALRQDFGLDLPKIAILALNPHASDNGLFGNEEATMIIPAVERLRKEEVLAFGPYGADGFFGSGQYKHFDGILAMYHDQGLIPFKALSFGSGVNFTAGLPIIRTSPDHGTAYDIAGRGEASEKSFLEAIFMAMDIIKNRRAFIEMNMNPIEKIGIDQKEESVTETGDVKMLKDDSAEDI